MVAKDNFEQEIQAGEVIVASVGNHARAGLVHRVVSLDVVRINYIDWWEYRWRTPPPKINIKRQEISRKERFVMKVNGYGLLSFLQALPLPCNDPAILARYISDWGKMYEARTGRDFQSIARNLTSGITIAP